MVGGNRMKEGESLEEHEKHKAIALGLLSWQPCQPAADVVSQIIMIYPNLMI